MVMPKPVLAGLIAFGAFLALCLGAAFIFTASAPSPAGKACTTEAMRCPDGSYVGRTGPDCEFAACPSTPSGGVGTTSSGAGNVPPIPANLSGIRGTALLGPTCPVERTPPDPGCGEKPYQGSLEVVSTSGTPMTTFATGSDGSFAVTVRPGTYVIRNISGAAALPRCSSGTITVPAQGFVMASVSCDTGIR